MRLDDDVDDFPSPRETLQKHVQAFIASGGEVEVMARVPVAWPTRTEWRETMPVRQPRPKPKFLDWKPKPKPKPKYRFVLAKGKESRQGVCKIAGCGRVIECKRLCQRHYYRSRAGLPMTNEPLRKRR